MVELLSLGHFVTAAAGRSYAPLLVLGWSSDTTRAGSPPALGCAPEAQGLPGLDTGGRRNYVLLVMITLMMTKMVIVMMGC